MGTICSNTDYSKPTRQHQALVQNSNNNGARKKTRTTDAKLHQEVGFNINGEYFACNTTKHDFVTIMNSFDLN